MALINLYDAPLDSRLPYSAAADILEILIENSSAAKGTEFADR